VVNRPVWGSAYIARVCLCLPAVLAVLLLPNTVVAQAPLPAEDPNAYRSISERAAALVQARSAAVPCTGGRGALRVVNTPAADAYKRGIQYVWVQLPKACASFRVAMVEASGDIVRLFHQHAGDAAIVASGGFRSRQQRLAEGGLVPSASPAPTTAPSQSVRIVNVIDPGMAADYLNSAAGEKTILNVLSRNGAAVRELLR